MATVRQTEAYERWFEKLRDRRAKARIAVRIRRLSLDNPGDVRRVGKSVSELRIDYGPGYRVYLVERSPKEVVLLNGGVKRTQEQDILRAHEMARRIRKSEH